MNKLLESGIDLICLHATFDVKGLSHEEPRRANSAPNLPGQSIPQGTETLMLQCLTLFQSYGGARERLVATLAKYLNEALVSAQTGSENS